MLIPIISWPDASNFISDNTQAWTAWLTLTQLSLAAFALVAAFAPRTYPWKVSLIAAALWYCIQGMDEWLAGNLFSDAMPEYVLFLLYCTLLTLHIRSHERGQRTA